jgi:CDP-6-deoxy-D-xylo-4-hexulose-3-dehydrase
MMAGLRVRFVDVDPRTLNIDFDDVERRITPATRALSLVHLMGNPCDMDRALGLAAKHDLVVVEDCCEALGSEWNGKKVGNFGFAAGFSFFFSHHMTTMEGGMITCQAPETADLARVLRAHGWLRNANVAWPAADDPDVDPRYTFVNWGFNVRPTELQAGFGLRQLEKLPAFNHRRQVLAERFFAYVDRTPCFRRPQVCESAKPAWFALPLVICGDAPFSRRDVVRYLEDSGVETRPIVAGNMARQPVARHFADFDAREYVGADLLHRNGFYVGLSPLHGIGHVDRLVECLSSFVARY